VEKARQPTQSILIPAGDEIGHRCHRVNLLLLEAL
jgi:hypothetical protein